MELSTPREGGNDGRLLGRAGDLWNEIIRLQALVVAQHAAELARLEQQPKAPPPGPPGPFRDDDDESPMMESMGSMSSRNLSDSPAGPDKALAAKVSALMPYEEAAPPTGLAPRDEHVAAGDGKRFEVPHSADGPGDSPPPISLRPCWHVPPREPDFVVDAYSLYPPSPRLEKRLRLTALHVAGPSQDRRRSRGMLHPLGCCLLFWRLLACAMAAYDVAIVPLQVFGWPRGRILKTADWAALGFWTLDLVVNFRTGIFWRGELLMDADAVADRYLRSWCALDAAVLVPGWCFSILSQLDGASEAGIEVLKATRVLQLLRAVRLGWWLHGMEDAFTVAWARLMLRTAQLTLPVAALCHLLTCLWYWAGQARSDGWVGRLPLGASDDGELYLISLQWVLAHLAGGTGSTVAALAPATVLERACAAGISLVALLVLSFFVASACSTLVRFQLEAQSAAASQATLDRFLQRHGSPGWHGLPQELSARGRQALASRCSWRLQGDREAQLFRSLLPTSLAQEMLVTARSPVLRWHGLFGALCAPYRGRGGSPVLARLLCAEVVTMEMHAGEDDVYTYGEASDSMLFVGSGRFLYQAPANDNGEVALLDKRRWLCEAALWLSSWVHTGSLSCRCEGESLHLNAARLSLLVRQDVQLHAKVAQHAEQFAHATCVQGCTDLGLCRSAGRSGGAGRNGAAGLSQPQMLML